MTSVSPPFRSELKHALRTFPEFKEDIKCAFERIEATPRAGDAVPRVGADIFKIRLGVKGRFGKSGGYRLIYHVDWSRRVITPLSVYFKRCTPNLADPEIIERVGQMIEYAAENPPGSLPPKEKAQ